MQVNFSTIMERIANNFGEREAMVNVERKRRYNFREYHLLTNRIVNMMIEKLGIGRGDHYLMILKNDNLSLLTAPTIFKGKGTACMTNYLDSAKDHAWQIDAVRPGTAFIEVDLLASHYEMLRERGIIIVCMDSIPEPYKGKDNLFCFWDLIEGVGDHNPDIEHDDREDILILRFSSGTTGKSTCAMYTIDNWLMSRDSFYAIPETHWHQDSRVLHFMPISHGSALLILPALFRGACSITMNTPDLSDWCANVEAEGVTTCFVVPVILYRLLEMQECKDTGLASLETIFYAAAPTSPAKLKLLQERFGNIFVQSYGSSEHSGIAIALPKYAHIVNSPEDEKRLASAGQTLPGVEILIVDAKGCPVVTGEIGEIWLRSRAVIPGYYNDPGKTEQEFERGFWKSADMGYMDEAGYIFIVDRKKDMIITGGFNVYAAEVEAAINSHPFVMMSAVIGIPDQKWGEAIHAEVILRDGKKLDSHQLIAHVKESLGGYKVPKSVEFVADLPTSAIGKVLRRKVRDKYWTGRDRMV